MPDGTDGTTAVWMSALKMVTAADVSARGKDMPLVGDALGTIPAPGDGWPELAASRIFLGELTKEFAAIRTAVDAGGAISHCLSCGD